MFSRAGWKGACETRNMQRSKGNTLLARALAAAFCLAPAALVAQPDIRSDGWDVSRIAACRKSADDAYATKDIETGNFHLRELIEACPGRWDLVCPALKTIHRASLRDGPDAWREYAAVRLIAAYRAGRILPTDPVLREAWETLITLREYQERFLEAGGEVCRAHRLRHAHGGPPGRPGVPVRHVRGRLLRMREDTPDAEGLHFDQGLPQDRLDKEDVGDSVPVKGLRDDSRAADSL